jgi:hypothetical protein
LYQYYLNKFGLKQVAEQKLGQDLGHALQLVALNSAQAPLPVRIFASLMCSRYRYARSLCLEEQTFYFRLLSVLEGGASHSSSNSI